jgi:hypothetical protein
VSAEALAARLARGPMPPAEALRLARVVLRALAPQHRQGRAHGGLCPTTIRVGAAGVELLPAEPEPPLDYQAPEIGEESPPTPAADVYAVGLLTWELLVGVPACPDGGALRKRGWHAGVGLPDVRQRAAAPASLAAAIARLAARSDRPADADAALVVLASVDLGDAAEAAVSRPRSVMLGVAPPDPVPTVESARPRTVHTPPVQPRPQPRPMAPAARSRVPALLALGVVVLGLAVVGGVAVVGATAFVVGSPPEPAAPTVDAAPPPPDVLLAEAQTAHRSGHPDAARSAVDRLLRDHPDAAEARAGATLAGHLDEVGRPAGDLSLSTWHQGGPDALSADGPTLMFFFEAWCPYSQRHAPGVQALADAHPALQVVGLTRQTRDTPDAEVQAFIADHGLRFAVARDPGALSDRFGVPDVPGVVLLQAGVVRWRGHPRDLAPGLVESWF